MSISNESMTEGFLKGDDFVLSQFYKNTFPVVRKYVVQNGGEDDDARDIFQEAITAAWLNTIEGKYKVRGTSELGGYIFQIAKYKWIDRMKSAHSRKTVRLEVIREEFSEEPPSDIAAERMEELTLLHDGLGDKCRQILELFYFEKKSLEEMGKILAHDASTLRTMKYRCMMQLRKMQEKKRGNAV